MPHRLNEFRAKIQFITSARMPSLIFKATLATDKVSNTVYIQHAVCEALSRDLGIPLEDLLSELPAPRSRGGTLIGPNRRPVPRAAATIEEVS